MRAQVLYKAGFRGLVSVIPPDGELAPASTIKPDQRGKVPGRFGTQGWYGYAWDQDYGEELAREIDESGANIGLRGSRYPGLDLDTEKEEITEAVIEIATKLLGPAPQRRSREPRRLLMYRAAEPFKKQAIILTDPEGESHTVEMLGDRRQYLLFGTHPSGERYRWDDFWNPAKLTVITEDQVREFFEAMASEFQALGFGTEITGGGKKTRAEPIPDRVVDGARNATMASLVGTMRQRNMSRDAALAAALAESEARFEQGGDWGPEEIERIVDSIYTNYKAGPYHVIMPAEQVFSADPAMAIEVEKGLPYTDRDAGEMALEPDDPILWAVNGLLPLRGSSIFGAKPKVGKSTLARSLAAAIVQGKEWLGMETQQGNVLYFRFPGEGTEQEARSEWRRLGVEPGAGLRDIEVDSPAEIQDHLGVLVNKYEPILIVVDTLQHLIQAKDMDDYAKVHQALAPIHALGKRAHVLCLHHSPKGDRQDLADMFLGSTALFAAVDVGMILRRQNDDMTTRIFEARGRGVELEPYVVGMDADTHEPYFAGTAKQFNLDQVEARIMATLAEYHPEPLSTRDLLDLVTGKTNTIRESLISLEKAGAIKRERDWDQRGGPTMHSLTEAGDVFTTRGEESDDAGPDESDDHEGE